MMRRDVARMKEVSRSQKRSINGAILVFMSNSEELDPGTTCGTCDGRVLRADRGIAAARLTF